MSIQRLRHLSLSYQRTIKSLTEDRDDKIMPTVKYKCKDSGKNMVRKFPYNAVGKAQATEFSNLMGGSIKYNPNKVKTEMGY